MINDPLFTRLTLLRAPYCKPTEVEGSGVIIMVRF